MLAAVSRDTVCVTVGGTEEARGAVAPQAEEGTLHPPLPVPLCKAHALPCRLASQDYGPIVSKDEHGRPGLPGRPRALDGYGCRKCFDEMLQNEKEFCGEWVVGCIGAECVHSCHCATCVRFFTTATPALSVPEGV